MTDDKKDRARLRLIATWLILAGAAIGLIVFFSAGPIATLVQNSQKTDTGSAKLTIYNDSNADGVQDPLDTTENPIGFISILLSAENNKAAAATSADGLALIENIPSGQYKVSFSYQDTNLSEQEITVDITKDKTLNKKIGLQGLPIINISEIFGRVIEDTNNNGRLDQTDLPIRSAVLTLKKENQTILKVSSGETGRYSIPARLVGSYTLVLSGQDKNKSDLARQVTINSNLDPQEINFLIPPQ